MIAKITQGTNFGGVINYVLNREEAQIIGTKGVRTSDKETMINSFNIQSKLNSIAKPVVHISLNFSARDRDKLTNSTMREIAKQYMDKMGYANTQVLMVRHNDREHPHVHMILNRIDFDGKRISDQNERIRNVKICKELSMKYELYISRGKENVKRHRLREPDKIKYEIYDSIKSVVKECRNWKELEQKLLLGGITMEFKTKSGTLFPQGVKFAKGGCMYNGSKIDRRFSYTKLDAYLSRDRTQKRSITTTATTARQTTRTTTHSMARSSVLTNISRMLNSGGCVSSRSKEERERDEDEENQKRSPQYTMGR